MAKLITKVQFDMGATGDLSVHDLLKGRDAKFDTHFIRLEYRKSHERDTFRGTFKADIGRKTVSGSAKTWTHSKNSHLQWEITNASISAAAVLAAAKTNKTKDDLAVIEKTFAGDDSITGSKFADKLNGYGGNDTINGGLGAGIDKLDGGDGHDRVSYADSNKAFVITLTGATKSIVLADGIADDRITNFEDAAGGKGNDIITGDKKDNLLLGNNGDDVLNGLKGNDTLLGGNQNDTLNGGAGKDLLDGGKHNDVLLGGGGDDTLLGGKGADSLDGGAGKDSLDGGAGADTLIGGGGRDTLTGGSDPDTFRFTSVSDSGAAADLITDFKHKQDKIDLSAIDAISSTVGIDDAFTWDGKGTIKTKHAEGHFGYYQVDAKGTANDHTYIVINNDADKAPEMTIELQGLVKLAPIDFIV